MELPLTGVCANSPLRIKNSKYFSDINHAAPYSFENSIS